MKAYMIKNKEGKYCQISFNGCINFVSELYCAYMYHSQQGAEKIIKCHELEDCKVVEITIYEGDLEEKCKELEKALELGAEKIEFMAQMLGQTLDYDVKENLIQQAKESEKDE
jgi:hypothetical protein